MELYSNVKSSTCSHSHRRGRYQNPGASAGVEGHMLMLQEMIIGTGNHAGVAYDFLLDKQSARLRKRAEGKLEKYGDE